MENPPEFLVKRETIQDEKTFQPASASGRGELIAWGSAVVIGLILTIFYFLTREIQCLTAGLFIFFLGAAILITFGLWVDSKTFAKVSPESVHFKSPFRDVRLDWDQVEEVRAMEAGSVWRVVVFGAGRYFRLRLLESEEDTEKGRRFLVIPQADRLMRIICGMAKLHYPRESEEEWICKRS